VRWLQHFLGTDNVSGAAYAWWSGAGSILLPWLLQAVTIMLLFWWHHQCAVHRCHRYARRVTAAGDRACARHHPEPRPGPADIKAAHHALLPLYHRTEGKP